MPLPITECQSSTTLSTAVENLPIRKINTHLLPPALTKSLEPIQKQELLVWSPSPCSLRWSGYWRRWRPRHYRLSPRLVLDSVIHGMRICYHIPFARMTEAIYNVFRGQLWVKHGQFEVSLRVVLNDETANSTRGCSASSDVSGLGWYPFRLALLRTSHRVQWLQRAPLRLIPIPVGATVGFLLGILYD